MTANRIPPTLSNTPGGISGSSYGDRIAEEIIALYDGRVNQVTSVAGTNTITGVCTPPLSGSYAHGQTFRLTPAGNNTGAVTVNLDSKGAADLRSEDNQALVSGDLISGVPITFWYDSTIGDFRLANRLLSSIVAELADDIAAGSIWEELGYTLVGAAVATVEHTFTADQYSMIKCVCANVSPATTSNTLNNSLRSSSTQALNVAVGAAALNASNVSALSTEFYVDRTSGTRRPFALYTGFINNSTVEVPTTITNNSTVIPDRVRWAFTSGNIDLGEFWTYGMRA